eukprot:gene14053-19992_t
MMTVQHVQVLAPLLERACGLKVSQDMSLWAISLARSRSFQIKADLEDPDARASSNSMPYLAMLPGIDLGEEVLIDYGARSNLDFMADYGFSLHPNPEDLLLLEDLSTGSPGSEYSNAQHMQPALLKAAYSGMVSETTSPCGSLSRTDPKSCRLSTSLASALSLTQELFTGRIGGEQRHLSRVIPCTLDAITSSKPLQSSLSAIVGPPAISAVDFENHCEEVKYLIGLIKNAELALGTSLHEDWELLKAHAPDRLIQFQGVEVYLEVPCYMPDHSDPIAEYTKIGTLNAKQAQAVIVRMEHKVQLRDLEQLLTRSTLFHP